MIKYIPFYNILYISQDSLSFLLHYWITLFYLIIQSVFMSCSVPILSRDQIEEVRNMVHGILEENTRIIDDVLNQLVEVQSTNILGLYNLVVEQWQKKQKIVDNLCHFSLTMLATVQLLWDQKYQNQQQLNLAKEDINRLQAQKEELKALNEQFRQQIKSVEIHDTPPVQPSDKIVELLKCQSCIHFREKDGQQEQNINKKCSSQGDDNIHSQHVDLANESERSSQVQTLIQDKNRLQRQLQQAIEESQLTKMQLQLAQLAIKDALTYKSSYLSLIQSSASRISDKSRSMDNIDYLNGEIECQSHIEDSFRKQAQGFFNIDHPRQDTNNKKQQTNNAGYGRMKTEGAQIYREYRQRPAMKSTINPFKKKSFNIDRNQQQQEDQHSKTIDQIDDSNDDQFEIYRPQSQIVDERKINEMINRFKLKKSKISDRQETAEESLETENSLFKPKAVSTITQNTKQKQQNSSASSSINTFYNFITKKVVRNRIRHK